MSIDSEESPSKGNILVVEDEIPVQEYISGMLTKKGYTVRVAGDGELALQSIHTELPDLILMDMNMPGMSGIDVCRKIKVDPETRNIPVIFLSAMGEVDLKVKALEAGGTDYVTKPAGPSEILARISTHLNMYRLQQKLKIQAEKLDAEIKERKQAEKKIEESENKYRQIFDTNKAIKLLIDPQDGSILEANKAACRYYGYSKEEIETKKIDDINVLPPDKVHSEMQKAKTENRLYFNFSHRLASGEERDVEVYSGPVVLGEKTVLYSVIHDVTDRVLAEEALKESEYYFSQIFKQSSTSMCLYNPDGTFNRVNDEFCKMFGVEAKGIINSGYNVLTNQAVIDTGVLPLLREVFDGKKNKKWEINFDTGSAATLSRISTSKPKKIYLEVYGHPILNNKGDLEYVVLQHHDITERKQAEEDLLKEKSLFKTIINNIPVMLTRYSPDANMLYLNKEFEKIIGWNTEEVQDIDMMEKVYPDPDYRQQAMDFMLKANLEWREFTVMSKSGEPIDSEWSNFCMEDGTQIGIGIDITERKQAEKDKVLMEEQYRQAQKMESVGRLAGGVAHDFNNVLSVIISTTEFALDDVEPTGQLRKDLDEILTASKRAADITRQLLAFARKQIITPRVLDLNESVEIVLKMLRRLIGEDIDLIWLQGASLWSVKADSSQIDQILANLCVNARDAIENVGKITIETENRTLDEVYCADHTGFVSGEFVQLSVSDNGCGMGKEILDNIFDPFFTTKDIDKGTGLGLATVYGIVKQNNGFIYVYSELNQGTTIKIYLPRHESKDDKAQVKIPIEILQGRGETILLVEDDLSILKLAKRILEELDYIVLTAGTPGAAITLAQNYTKEIHLLVTDVIMPEMNGRELSERLQSLFPNLKRMFMSGYTADAISHHGVLDEGVHFTQKPFSKIDLAKTARKALDED